MLALITAAAGGGGGIACVATKGVSCELELDGGGGGGMCSNFEDVDIDGAFGTAFNIGAHCDDALSPASC